MRVMDPLTMPMLVSLLVMDGLLLVLLPLPSGMVLLLVRMLGTLRDSRLLLRPPMPSLFLISRLPGEPARLKLKPSMLLRPMPPLLLRLHGTLPTLTRLLRTMMPLLVKMLLLP